MNRDELACEIVEDMTQRPEIFTPLEIEQIYGELRRYTLADDETKQAHIDAMRWGAKQPPAEDVEPAVKAALDAFGTLQKL